MADYNSSHTGAQIDSAIVQVGTHTADSDIHFSATERTKLSGVASGANNYTHPSTAGNKHIPSGGASGQILRWNADGTAAWGADNDTIYTHPATHPPSIIVQDANNRFVTDSKMATWDSKQAALTTVSQAIAEAGTSATVYGWTPQRVAQAIAALGGGGGLYEKIRDIPDASGSNSLSIDLSDIDWNTYSEIRLIGRFWADAGINLRINNLSDAYYATSEMRAGLAYYNITNTYITEIHNPRPDYPARFDISITKHIFNSYPRWAFRLNQVGTYDTPTIGISVYKRNVATLTSFNFVASSTPYTVSIADASLWGMKK